MNLLRDLYLKYSLEFDVELTESKEYPQLLDEFHGIIKTNMEDKKSMQELDVLLGIIGAVIAEKYCIAGIKFGAKLMHTLLYEGGE